MSSPETPMETKTQHVVANLFYRVPNGYVYYTNIQHNVVYVA